MTAAEIIRLDTASAGYGTRSLWRDLSVTVRAGELMAVVGGNGAGKSTLLRMLLGQVSPTGGRVSVFGSPPRRGNPRVGYVPQQRAFPADLTLRGQDLVRLGVTGHRWGLSRASEADRRRTRQAIESVGATGFATAPVGSLSGGEQQRLRIAQALVSEPALLLADEPLLSLDQSGQRQVMDLFDAHRRDRDAAVVVVTHEINPVLPYVDQVLYLTDSDWATGTPEEVFTNETLSRLYRSPVEVVQVRGQLVVVGVPDDSHHLADATGEPRTV